MRTSRVAAVCAACFVAGALTQAGLAQKKNVGFDPSVFEGSAPAIGAKLLAGLLTNVLASQYAMGITAIERPVPSAGRGGLVCAHCGFASAHVRAFYCPKCGMRLLRG